MFGSRRAKVQIARLLQMVFSAVFFAQITAGSLAAQETGSFPSDLITILNGNTVGSAFPIAPTLIATNAHVVRGMQTGDAVTFFSYGSGKRKQRGVLIAVSPQIDLAIVQVDPSNSFHVAVTAEHVPIGSRVVTQGSSARFGQVTVRQSHGFLQSGPRHIGVFGTGFIARFQGITAGFSGGPVVDSRGRLIGMLSAISLSPTSSTKTYDAFIIGIEELLIETDRLLKAINGERTGSG